MKSIHLSCCAAGALLLGLAFLSADELPLTPVLESTTHLGGSRTKAVWSPQSNGSYRVEKSTDLSPGSNGGAGSWSTRALVEGGEWTDPEPPGQRAFYRVPAPQAEVFAVEPAVVAQSGGMLTLVAQCLPPGSLLRVEIPGEPALLLPIMPGPDGSYQVVLNGLPPGTPYIGTLSVVNAAGQPVATVGQTLEVTDSGRTTESPPAEPPAWRAAVLKLKTKSNQSNDRVAPALEFTSGNPAILSVELFFDTYEQADDPYGSAAGSQPQFSLLTPALRTVSAIQ